MQQQTIVAIAKVAHQNPMDAFKKSSMGKSVSKSFGRERKTSVTKKTK